MARVSEDGLCLAHPGSLEHCQMKVQLKDQHLDGVVQSVSRVDTSPAQTLVSYSYGTSGITKVQVLK